MSTQDLFKKGHKCLLNLGIKQRHTYMYTVTKSYNSRDICFAHKKEIQCYQERKNVWAIKL